MMIIDNSIDVFDDLLEMFIVHVIDRPFWDLVGIERFTELHYDLYNNKERREQEETVK